MCCVVTSQPTTITNSLIGIGSRSMYIHTYLHPHSSLRDIVVADPLAWRRWMYVPLRYLCIRHLLIENL